LHDLSGELLGAVYDQLRAIAQQRMSAENPGHTLQATALVHEAFVRIGGDRQVQFRNRAHFFATAAEAMRRILVDKARSRGRLKRGGDRNRVDLDKLELAVDDPPDELIALNEALLSLAKEHPDKAQLVKLRFFGGLTHEEAAQALGISISSADRQWSYARAWLYRHMAAHQGSP
jgi:RNA polymerase sigma factor (TIGR02999 family)